MIREFNQRYSQLSWHMIILEDKYYYQNFILPIPDNAVYRVLPLYKSRRDLVLQVFTASRKPETKSPTLRLS